MNLFAWLQTHIDQPTAWLHTFTLLICLLAAESFTWVLRIGFRRYLKPPHALLASVAPLIATLITLFAVIIVRQQMQRHGYEIVEFKATLRFLMLYLLLHFLRFAALQTVVNLHMPRAYLDLLKRIVARSFWAVVLLYLSNLWFDWWSLLNEASISVGERTVTVIDIARGLILIIITVLIAAWGSTALNRVFLNEQTFDLSTRLIFTRLIRALIIFVALLLGMSFAGVDLTLLSIFSGALGIGLGLGLQRIVSNYVSGLLILVNKSIRIGDFIALDKNEGRVVSVTARYSVLRTLQGIEIVIPNEALVLQTVRNYTLSPIAVRADSTFYLSLDTDIKGALELAVATMKNVPRVVSTPLPEAFFVTAWPFGYEIDLGFWLIDYERGVGDVRSDVNLAVLKAWTENGFMIAHLPEAGRNLLQRKLLDKR